MQSFREQQEEIRQLSQMNYAKKQQKTIAWEKLGSLQENWTYEGNSSCKDSTIKDRNAMDLIEV